MRYRSHITPGYLAVLAGEGAAYVLLAARGIAVAIANLAMLALVLLGALAVAFGMGLIGVTVAMGGVRFEPLVARWWPFPFPPPGASIPVPQRDG